MNSHTLFRLFNEIGIVNQLSSNRFARALPEGLSLAQFSVLNNFVRLGGTRSPKQLADAFQVTKGAMTNTLNRLQENGLILIEPDPVDRRAKVVQITPAGREMREQALQGAFPAMLDLQGLLTDSEIEAMLASLTKLRTHLDRNR